MKLSDYMAAEGLTQREFARLIGTDQAGVSRFLRGRQLPRAETMTKIAEVTNGLVTPNDFYDLGAANPPQSAPPP